MSECRLVSVNIEGDRHLSRVIPFLEKKDPDVICLQEVFKDDLQIMMKRFAMQGIFVPMTRRPRGPYVKGKLEENELLWGLAIATRLPILERGWAPYAGNRAEVPSFIWGDERSYRRVLAHIVVEKGGEHFTFLNTHFTWTPDGEPSDVQRHDMPALIRLLEKYPDLVLCGDMNAPRGGEIFAHLTERYTDNVPLCVTTTIDGSLHRAGHLEYVVDALLSSPAYIATDVSVESGVSDHCALVATVARSI